MSESFLEEAALLNKENDIFKEYLELFELGGLDHEIL